jgi:hypothetical protein
VPDVFEPVVGRSRVRGRRLLDAFVLESQDSDAHVVDRGDQTNRAPIPDMLQHDASELQRG